MFVESIPTAFWVRPALRERLLEITDQFWGVVYAHLPVETVDSCNRCAAYLFEIVLLSPLAVRRDSLCLRANVR
jgi:hypothetical protein